MASAADWQLKLLDHSTVDYCHADCVRCSQRKACLRMHDAAGEVLQTAPNRERWQPGAECYETIRKFHRDILPRVTVLVFIIVPLCYLLNGVPLSRIIANYRGGSLLS